VQGTLDLFAPREVPPEVAANQAKDNFHVRFEQVAVSQVPVVFDVANTASEVAHIVAPFRKHAQETSLASMSILWRALLLAGAQNAQPMSVFRTQGR